MHWIDNADSYICPVCGFETDNPLRFKCKCPVCGFIDEKDRKEMRDKGKTASLDYEVEYIEREVAKKVLRFGVGATAAEALDKAPAADVAPVVHGRWEENEHGYVCSECRDCFLDGYYMNEETLAAHKYCSNCGAKMDGKE